ncbi:MAG: hypothetical protein ACMUEL_02510 [Flavobacteriales bacterium Tduv]
MSKPRWGVEHTFVSIKRWFVSGKARSLQRISSCAYPASYGYYGV